MSRTKQFKLGFLRGPESPLLRLTAAVSRLDKGRRPGFWFGYTVAILAALVATLLRLWLGQLLGQNLHPFITFYPFIMLAALYGGTGPGLLATFIAALASRYYFLSPAGAFAVEDPADRVAFFLFIAINVAVSVVCGALRSARYRTVAEARHAEASEERFRLFMDHTPTLAWIKDDQGRYTYVNKAYEQRFGHSLAECQGRTDADLWPPDVAIRLQEGDRAAFAVGHPIELMEETTEPNGNVSFWLNTKFPIRDAAGHQFIASIGLDITERKRFQEAVEESETRLRLAVETAGLGTYERDLVTNEIILNPACEAILGAKEPFPPDLAPNSAHPEDRERVLAEVVRAFDPNLRAICSAEFRILRPDGTIRWVAGRGRVLFDDCVEPPKPIRFLGVLNDITERKEAEQALCQARDGLAQANAQLDILVRDRTAQLEQTVAELEHFSYTITHDMRAPLRAITGYASVLTSLYAASLKEQGRDLLRRIAESALRMDQLITDALQYSRVVRDSCTLQPLDPAAAIRGIVESYPQFQWPNADITIQTEMPHVLANQAALTQVFSNLLGNAVKFVIPGQVPQITVTAELHRRPDAPMNPSDAAPTTAPSSAEWVRIYVTDNGIGIPPEYHGKIWQMFQRLSKDREGTGIGLALVRKVVERIGGRVGLESAPQQGSRFWVELQKAP